MDAIYKKRETINEKYRDRYIEQKESIFFFSIIPCAMICFFKNLLNEDSIVYNVFSTAIVFIVNEMTGKSKIFPPPSMGGGVFFPIYLELMIAAG